MPPRKFSSDSNRNTQVALTVESHRVTTPPRMVACSVCCFFWFVAACIFAGVFGWAYMRDPSLETQCVRIKLLPNTSSIDDANGYFDVNGNECVYRSTIPDVCVPYYKGIPDCPANGRRLGEGENGINYDVFITVIDEIWGIGFWVLGNADER